MPLAWQYLTIRNRRTRMDDLFYPAMSALEKLGYEPLRALAILDKTPGIEGTALCSRADCSWDEMFKMAEMGLIDAGADRLEPKRMHPTLTDLGKETLRLALERLPSLAE
jgi:hypothetical protein